MCKRGKDLFDVEHGNNLDDELSNAIAGLKGTYHEMKNGEKTGKQTGKKRGKKTGEKNGKQTENKRKTNGKQIMRWNATFATKSSSLKLNSKTLTSPL